MKKNWLILLLISFWACSDGTVEDPMLIDQAEDYIPLALGQEMLFDLDSVIYDPEVGEIVVDTISYELKYEVVDTFRDGENDLTYRIERFIRDSTSQPWQITDVWSAKKTDRRYVWTEENLPYIKLVFPLSEDSRWDGNALFDDDNVEVKVRGESLEVFKFWGDYQIVSRGAEEINGRQYDDVLTVLHVDREISIEKRYSLEKYARGVGLVYSEFLVLDTQNQNVAQPFEERAERGFIVRIKRK